MPNPSCLHTLYTIWNVTMHYLLYIQVLGVNIEDPPQVNIKLDFSCGCEAPTQTHKSHHQTHEAPTSIQRWFSPNEECNVVPMMISTCPTPRACENTYLKLQKSTLVFEIPQATHPPRGNMITSYWFMSQFPLLVHDQECTWSLFFLALGKSTINFH